MERKPHFTQTGVRHGAINGHRFHLRLTEPTEENFPWIGGKSPPLVLDHVAAEFLGFLIDAMWTMQQGTGDETEECSGCESLQICGGGSAAGCDRKLTLTCPLCIECKLDDWEI